MTDVLDITHHGRVTLFTLNRPDKLNAINRQMALDLFDAFASPEKTLHANMGGHTGIPAFAGEDAAGFFARHPARRRTRDDRDGMPGAHRRLASSDRFGVRPPR